MSSPNRENLYQNTPSKSESEDFLESLDKQLLDLKNLLNKTDYKLGDPSQNEKGDGIENDIINEEMNESICHNNEELEQKLNIYQVQIQRLQNCISSVQDEKFRLLQTIDNLNTNILELMQQNNKTILEFDSYRENIQEVHLREQLELQTKIQDLIKQNHELKQKNRQLTKDNLKIIEHGSQSIKISNQNPLDSIQMLQQQMQQMYVHIKDNSNKSQVYEQQQELDRKSYEIEDLKAQLLKIQIYNPGQECEIKEKKTIKNKQKQQKEQQHEQAKPKRKLIFKKTNKSAIDSKNIIQEGRRARSGRAKNLKKYCDIIQDEVSNSESFNSQDSSNNESNQMDQKTNKRKKCNKYSNNYEQECIDQQELHISIEVSEDYSSTQVGKNNNKQYQESDDQEEEDVEQIEEQENEESNQSEYNDSERQQSENSEEDECEEEQDDEENDQDKDDKESEYCPSLRVSKMQGSDEEYQMSEEEEGNCNQKKQKKKRKYTEDDNDDDEDKENICSNTSIGQNQKQQANKNSKLGKKPKQIKKRGPKRNLGAKKRGDINQEYKDQAFNCIENMLYF